MEILDVFDLYGNKLDKTIVRGEKLKENEYLNVTTIWIKSGIRYLIQLCSKAKGGKYAVTGGCIPSGKSSFEQIKVEVKEEIGLDLKDENIKYLGRVVHDILLLDVYFYEDEEIDLEDFNYTLQKEEVEEIVWISKDEIEDLIMKDMFRESSALQYMKLIRDNY